MKTKSDAKNLADYRENVLGLRQLDIANAAGCKQGWISQIERGHKPKQWSRKEILDAYRLTNEEFENLFAKSAPEVADITIEERRVIAALREFKTPPVEFVLGALEVLKAALPFTPAPAPEPALELPVSADAVALKKEELLKQLPPDVALDESQEDAEKPKRKARGGKKSRRKGAPPKP